MLLLDDELELDELEELLLDDDFELDELEELLLDDELELPCELEGSVELLTGTLVCEADEELSDTELDISEPDTDAPPASITGIDSGVSFLEQPASTQAARMSESMDFIFLFICISPLLNSMSVEPL